MRVNPLHIGLCHYKVGGTDGVSLEMDKWKKVLERMGHTVHLCGGDLGTGSGCLIPELYHHRADVERMAWNTFHTLQDYPDGAALEHDIAAHAHAIVDKLQGFIADEAIDLLIPNNIWSIGANPAAAVAFTNVIKSKQIPAIGHHHDFWWESFRGMRPTCLEAARLIDKYLPPTGPTIKHVVINSFAQDELRARRGAEATIVPNVFDFSGSDWRIDDYNHDFRAEIGVEENDILILQATRIVPRKGIELAIDLVAALDRGENRRALEQRGLYDRRPFGQKNRIVLVLAGYSEDPAEEYLTRLKKKAMRTGVELRVISDRVRSRRGRTKDGRKVYSLWDCYVFADLITYPSLYEGWGNQFLEAVFARVPLVIFEYPVYKADIKDNGFTVISLGDKLAGKDKLGLVRLPAEVIPRATNEAITVLTDPEVRARMVEHNFELGKRYYSLESLEGYLKEILAGVPA